ncbi:MAG: putative rane protein [Campylobacterota bacterium]|nr:putative rane protein [Campylobacterota bacterium]
MPLKKIKISLFFTYLSIWVYLSIDPLFFDDWLLENLLVFVAVPLILIFNKKYNFSLESSIYLFVFMSLHAVGSHYTYSHMPFFNELKEAFGFDRNYYDRIVHFLFGYLIFIPLMELLLKNGIKKSIAIWFAFFMIVSFSAFYEIVEWLATEVTNPDLGIAFLGAQGDVWDAQKDSALAICGSVLGIMRGIYVKNR